MSGGNGHGRVSASVLSGSPEIAVLDGLGHTLRIAIAVTRALNPELAAPWSVACALRVKAATLVLAHAESLLCAGLLPRRRRLREPLPRRRPRRPAFLIPLTLAATPSPR